MIVLSHFVASLKLLREVVAYVSHDSAGQYESFGQWGCLPVGDYHSGLASFHERAQVEMHKRLALMKKKINSF